MQSCRRPLQSCREGGATSVEYGLMVLLIALAIITAVSVLGGNLNTFVADTASSV
ncbi:Flp family type IVb pilin [Intrasporangium sp. DVR]|uniref:Flp family type IVb pilin n=1 Tax=Intrasporangium sp. DVR TaxID=3127867 RepID=UPI003340CFC7